MDFNFLVNNFGFSPNHVNMSFNDLEDNEQNEKIVPLLKNYINNFSEFRKNGVGLLFVGSSGSGKSTYSSIVLKNLIVKHNIYAYIMSLDSVLELQVDSWKDKLHKFSRDKKLYQSTILLLDNIENFSSKSRDHREVLSGLIKKRIDSGKITFVTSSLNDEELKNFLGKDLDNILKSCIIKIGLPKIDYRLKKVDAEKLKNLLIKGKKQ